MTVVDIEIERRISEGFRNKFGAEIEPSELERFHLLAKLSGTSPLVNTFDEIDLAIHKVVSSTCQIRLDHA